MIVFRSAFFCARLGTAGAHWQEILGDGLQQLLEEGGLSSWMSCERVNGIGEMMQAVQRSLE